MLQVTIVTYFKHTLLHYTTHYTTHTLLHYTTHYSTVTTLMLLHYTTLHHTYIITLHYTTLHYTTQHQTGTTRGEIVSFSSGLFPAWLPLSFVCNCCCFYFPFSGNGQNTRRIGLIRNALELDVTVKH